ncbi:MFS transporter [Chthonobacter rhizosphaerae]|uniref:MFS transporter n=1 Tax=Chthonobacter rhizosphaerae TaxID=2735553 RepID=UPI0015EE9585|nr:MFS transporter [Chthonobacter rhizosphaerae]
MSLSATASAGPSPNAFAYRPFVYYWLSRTLGTFGVQIVSVCVGWKVYDLTRDPLSLGIVGLVQFLPALALVLFTGAVADRYSRRKIMAVCIAAEFLCTAVLYWVGHAGLTEVWPIYLTLVAIGVARAFFGPAMQALVPNLVPSEALANAIAWNSSSWQIAAITGPVLGGLLYGVSEFAAYGTALVILLAAGVLILMVPKQPRTPATEEKTWDTVSAGFRYVFTNRIVLGAISLDLFAVLLGGAVALMPVYARDILEVGPWGLGLMRAAPGVGALVVAAALGLRPIGSHAGLWMFVAVAGFGLSTIVFGLSGTAWVSIAALALMGATDMVSVYVRETMIQLATPDDVRGRVNAVNMVFVGASNELGEFRAGVSAALIGVVPAVVFGGVGTVAVAALWARWFPELRRVQRLDGH